MRIIGSTIQQLEKDKPRGKCRKWRLWATTDSGRKSRRFAGTYTQAQGALKAFVDELGAQIPNSDTFGAYAASWALWRAESGNYSPNTVKCEGNAVRALRRTELDGMRMDAITPESCRNALLWLKAHPKGGKEYKQSTLGKFHQVLHAVMRQAVDDGKLASNPMDKVSRPKSRPAEREALSPDELQMFLNRVDGLPLDGRTVALYLMACLGLRCGEACALRVDEVSGGCVRVTSTIRTADGSRGPTKSPAGKRALPMPPRLKEKVDEWMELRGRLGLDSEMLCCTLKGDVGTASLQTWWSGDGDRGGARDRLGCPGMTMHQLRHSNLSMMARHMSVFDLQRYAGWSSIAPAKVYVHGDMDAVSAAVAQAWVERTNRAPTEVA